jgi:hypothetical protein
MSDPQWTFAERSQNDVEQEVTEADQFNSEATGLSETLIREAVQNSQDARTGDGPVRMRIHMAEPDTSFLNGLLVGLEDRLQASGFDAPTGGKALVIEDFGTKGLTGSVDDHTSKDNFRSFFFRHGGSFKGGSQNGRWGLGKLVFPMSSNARCFFGLTRREGDPATHLLGEAVLKTHAVGEKKFAPHGHFGRLEGSLILPVNEPAFIAAFSREFGVKRREEPGLSVIIPWAAAEPDGSEMAVHIARNYLWPILSGALVVDVMGTTIDAASIVTLGENVLPMGLVDFVQSVTKVIVSGSPMELRAPIHGPGGTLESAETLVPEEAIASLRDRFAAGELCSFYIPIPLGKKSDPVKAASSIKVFLRQAPEGAKGEALYIRNAITVPEEARSFRGGDIYVAMVADEGDAAAFLADAENPAHTAWNANAQRLKGNWKYPNQSLSFIRNAPKKLHALLSTGKEVEVRNALLDFFYVDDPVQSKKAAGKGAGAKKKADPAVGPDKPDDIPSPKPRKYRIDQRIGGFTVAGAGGLEAEELPRSLRVRLGYDIEGRNAVRSWDKFDFDLSDLKDFEEVVSGVAPSASGNEIFLEITEPDFEFTLTGFDINRDLVVEAAFVTGG